MAESGHENRVAAVGDGPVVRVGVLGVLAVVYLLAVLLGIVAQDERLSNSDP